MSTADDIRRLVKEAFPYIEDPRLPGLDRAAALHNELFETIATAMVKLKIKPSIVFELPKVGSNWGGPTIAQTVAETEDEDELFLLTSRVTSGAALHTAASYMSSNGHPMWSWNSTETDPDANTGIQKFGESAAESLNKTPEQLCDCGYFKHKFPSHVRGCPAEDKK